LRVTIGDWRVTRVRVFCKQQRWSESGRVITEHLRTMYTQAWMTHTVYMLDENLHTTNANTYASKHIKNKFLCSAISNTQDCSKRFIL